MKKKILMLGLLFILLSAFVVGCGGGTDSADNEPAANGEWKPEKSIEFVVPYGAGGGSDTNARVLADAIQKNNLVDQTITVVNKTGGSGAVGNAYTFAKKGDPHTIMTWNSGQMMSTVANNAEVSLEHFTPIGNLALDHYILAVKADKFRDFAEMLEEAKAKPDSITIGGVSKGSEDHLSFSLVNKYAGAKFKYVSFDGSGDVMSKLLGGHVDAGIFNPGEVISQIEAGEVVGVAVFATERLSGAAADIPTFTELGYPDIKFTQFRGYVGPPDMPEEAVKFWEEVLRKAGETTQWGQEYCETNLLDNYYLNAAESKAFFEEELVRYKELLKETGIIK